MKAAAVLVNDFKFSKIDEMFDFLTFKSGNDTTDKYYLDAKPGDKYIRFNVKQLTELSTLEGYDEIILFGLETSTQQINIPDAMIPIMAVRVTDYKEVNKKYTELFKLCSTHYDIDKYPIIYDFSFLTNDFLLNKNAVLIYAPGVYVRELDNLFSVFTSSKTIFKHIFELVFIGSLTDRQKSILDKNNYEYRVIDSVNLIDKDENNLFDIISRSIIVLDIVSKGHNFIELLSFRQNAAYFGDLQVDEYPFDISTFHKEVFIKYLNYMHYRMLHIRKQIELLKLL